MGEIDLLRISASLLFILALIAVLAWLIRRSSGTRVTASNRPMRIVCTQSLGPRTQVSMLHVGNKYLILGITAQQITLLDSLPAEFTPAVTTSESSTSFIHTLRSLLQRGA